jgi:hypothetical protein
VVCKIFGFEAEGRDFINNFFQRYRYVSDRMFFSLTLDFLRMFFKEPVTDRYKVRETVFSTRYCRY